MLSPSIHSVEDLVSYLSNNSFSNCYWCVFAVLLHFVCRFCKFTFECFCVISLHFVFCVAKLCYFYISIKHLLTTYEMIQIVHHSYVLFQNTNTDIGFSSLLFSYQFTRLKLKQVGTLQCFSPLPTVQMLYTTIESC